MGNEFEVNLDLLDDDANAWTGVGDDLAAMATTVAGLTLDMNAFTFLGRAAAEAHETVRAHTEALLTAGAEEARAAGSTLMDIYNAYKDDDEAARRRYATEWTFSG